MALRNILLTLLLFVKIGSRNSLTSFRWKILWTLYSVLSLMLRIKTFRWREFCTNLGKNNSFVLACLLVSTHNYCLFPSNLIFFVNFTIRVFKSVSPNLLMKPDKINVHIFLLDLSYVNFQVQLKKSKKRKVKFGLAYISGISHTVSSHSISLFSPYPVFPLFIARHEGNILLSLGLKGGNEHKYTHTHIHPHTTFYHTP